MSNNKPDLVFAYHSDNGTVYIIARHEKGAKSVARENGINISANEQLEKVSAAYAIDAINSGN